MWAKLRIIYHCFGTILFSHRDNTVWVRLTLNPLLSISETHFWMIKGTLSADASFSTRWRSSTPNTVGGGRSLRRGNGVTNCSKRVNFTYSKPRGSRRTHSCWLREATGERDRKRESKDKQIRGSVQDQSQWRVRLGGMVVYIHSARVKFVITVDRFAIISSVLWLMACNVTSYYRIELILVILKG